MIKEDNKKEGREMKLFNICIGKKLKDELKDICDIADYSLSEFTRSAIRAKIRDEKVILSQYTQNDISCSTDSLRASGTHEITGDDIQ